MEQVGEALEGRVALVAKPVAGVFGQMQRQRSIRPEQAEEQHQQPIRMPRLPRAPAGQHGRREIDRRLLRQPDAVLRRPHALPEARPVAVQRFQLAHHAVERERVRRGGDPAGEIVGCLHHRIARPPRRSGQRITSPRSTQRSVVSVKPLIDTYLAKNRSKTLASSHRAAAAERGLVDRQRQP